MSAQYSFNDSYATVPRISGCRNGLTQRHPHIINTLSSSSSNIKFSDKNSASAPSLPCPDYFTAYDFTTYGMQVIPNSSCYLSPTSPSHFSPTTPEWDTHLVQQIHQRSISSSSSSTQSSTQSSHSRGHDTYLSPQSQDFFPTPSPFYSHMLDLDHSNGSSSSYPPYDQPSPLSANTYEYNTFDAIPRPSRRNSLTTPYPYPTTRRRCYSSQQDFDAMSGLSAASVFQQNTSTHVPLTRTTIRKKPENMLAHAPNSTTPAPASQTNASYTFAQVLEPSGVARSRARHPSTQPIASPLAETHYVHSATSPSSSSDTIKKSTQQAIRFVNVTPMTSSRTSASSSNLPTHAAPNIPQPVYKCTSAPCADTTRYISFSTSSSPGVRLADLLNANTALCGFDDLVLVDETSHSATLRLWWPGEKSARSVGLPLKRHGRTGGPITRRELGQRAANAVERILKGIISENQGITSNSWRVVESGDGIKIKNLILVGLDRVSRGSWQPILRHI